MATRLYHISRNPKLTTLVPKKPKNGWVEYGIEEGKTGRVSFAPTIMGCVRGVDDTHCGKNRIRNTLMKGIANFYSKH